MKILVTGAAGNLGRAILTKCRGRHTVVGLDITELPADLAGEDHVRFSIGDAFDPAFFREHAIGCDAICHTAALHGGHLKTHSQEQFLQTNAIGANMICQAMVDLEINRIAFSSTSEITIGREWNHSGPAVITEHTPACPDSSYSLSKFMAEQVYSYFSRRHGLRVSNLRYCGFGYLQAQQVGTNRVSRYLESTDVAEANLCCIENDAIRNEVLYVGPINPLSGPDMVTACADPHTVLEKYWPGCVDRLEKAGQPTDGPLWPKLDATRLCQITGWQPEHTFETLLDQLEDF